MAVKRLSHSLLRGLGVILLVGIVTLALLNASARILFSQLNSFSPQIEQLLSENGLSGVNIGHIRGYWRGVYPVFNLHNTVIKLSADAGSVVFDELELGINPIASIFEQRLVVSTLYGNIDKLVLQKNKAGGWLLNDFPLLATSTADAEFPLDKLHQLLPNKAYLQVRKILLQDKQYGESYLLQKARLSARRLFTHIRWDVDVQLPPALGQTAELALKGNFDQQQLYLQVKGLNLPAWSRLGGYDLSQWQSALMDGQGWVELKQFKPYSFISKGQLAEITFLAAATEPHDSTSRQSFGATSMDWRLQGTGKPDGWHLVSHFDRIKKSRLKLPDLSSQILFEDGLAIISLDEIEVGHLRILLAEQIDSTPSLLPLSKLQPRARINNLLLGLTTDSGQLRSLGFDFQNLRNHAYGEIPALSGLNGRLAFAGGRGIASLDSTRLSTDFRNLFRLPFKFSSFETKLDFAWYRDLLLLQTRNLQLANEDLKLQARAWMEVPAQGLPFLSLRARYQDGRAGSVSRYLPVSIMPKHAVAWLDSSIKEGDIESGDLLFHGRTRVLSDLSDNHSGIFHTRFDAKNPRIDIFGDWPFVKNGRGSVSFRNVSMTAEFSDVDWADIRARKVKARIPDLLKSRLLLDIESQSEANRLLNSLAAMPVLNTFDEVRDKTETLNGNIESQVHINIPLSDELTDEVSVQAQASLDNVSWSLPDWSLQFDQLSGSVDIVDELINAQGLSGRYRGDEVSIDILSSAGKPQTDFYLSGDLRAQTLTYGLGDFLARHIQGQSPWRVNVSLPHDIGEPNQSVSVRASSELQGTAISLPKPLNIEQDQQQGLQLDIKVFSDELHSIAKFNDKLVLSTRLNGNRDSGYELSGMEIHFNGETAGSIASDKLIMQGSVEELDADGWWQYFSRYFDQDESKGSLLDDIGNVDIQVGKMELGGQYLVDTSLNMQQENNMLIGDILSSLAKGSFMVPIPMSPLQPFQANLEYLRLTGSQSDESFSPALESMPNLDIHSKSLVLGDSEFTGFRLKTRSDNGVFEINKLNLNRDDVELKIGGLWKQLPESETQTSRIYFAINGENLGQSMTNLNMGKMLSGGQIEAKGQIGWQGSLFEPGWESLDGDLKLSLKNGYLLEVDPGAGRLIGLLSFNALLKRLILDFGDVFNKGLKFKRISGDFTLKGEVLHTENGYMSSDSSIVHVNGDSNIRQQTYDQKMVVKPRVADTLPVIGGLAAGNTVGWGILLLQKILGNPVEKSVQIEYNVSGSWDDPVITKVKKPNKQSNLKLENTGQP